LSGAIVLGPVLAARALAVLPRPFAAAALVLAVGLEAPRLSSPPPPLEWREAATYLDEIARRTEGPVLLNPGFVDQNVLARPGGATPEKAAFIASPFETRPG